MRLSYRAAAGPQGLGIVGLPVLSLLALLLTACGTPATMKTDSTPLRVATFNVAMHGEQAGDLLQRLRGDDPQARQIAAIVQAVRPDILLLNEFDYEPTGESVQLFIRDYLGRGLADRDAIDYPHHYFAEVNTGVPSGLDLSGDGRNDGRGDAWGFGSYPGQYGMLLLSRYPIDLQGVRSFRELRWSAMPAALRPEWPDGRAFYSDQVWQQLRLSSKSHWDVPVLTPDGVIHLLAAHPTPPVFDGPERRNQRRNHDEIRLWADYISAADDAWIVDDAGQAGGLAATQRFVIVGDYNADPVDGNSIAGAIQQLLDHPRVLSEPVPSSQGGVWWAMADGGVNAEQDGNPEHDTSHFSPQVGNMRVDYVLPSRGFRVVDAGVFWPLPDQPDGDRVAASDHRLVWLDLIVIEHD